MHQSNNSAVLISTSYSTAVPGQFDMNSDNFKMTSEKTLKLINIAYVY